MDIAGLMPAKFAGADTQTSVRGAPGPRAHRLGGPRGRRLLIALYAQFPLGCHPSAPRKPRHRRSS